MIYVVRSNFIISEKVKAVQYNSDKGWSTWLDAFKNKIPEVSKEADDFFKKLKDINVNLTSDAVKSMIDANVFDDYIKNQNLADESLIAFLKDTNYGKKDLVSYQQYLKDTGKATSTFTDFTKKAGTVLKSFGAALGSMAVNWVISEVFELAVTAITNYINRVEIAREKLEETTSELQSVESENKKVQY